MAPYRLIFHFRRTMDLVVGNFLIHVSPNEFEFRAKFYRFVRRSVSKGSHRETGTDCEKPGSSRQPRPPITIEQLDQRTMVVLKRFHEKTVSSVDYDCIDFFLACARCAVLVSICFRDVPVSVETVIAAWREWCHRRGPSRKKRNKRKRPWYYR